MTEISIALLTLPDGRIVFQRRGAGAPMSPNLLGFFGGHVDEGETFDEAMHRELKEETSLDVDELIINHMTDYELEVQPGKTVSFHLYASTIPNMDFEVFEGDRAEAYQREGALVRDDLTPSAKHVLTNILGES